MKIPSRHVLLAAGLGFVSLLCTRRKAPGRIDENEASLGGATVLEGVQPLLVEMLCLMWSLMLVRAWSMTEGDSNALIGDRPKFFDPAPVSLDWQNCWLGHLEVVFIEHQHSHTQSAVSLRPSSRHRYGSRQTRSPTSPTRAVLDPHRDNAKQVGANLPKCSLIKPHSLLPPQRSWG